MGHLPTANGTYDEYASHAGGSSGDADYTYWDDTAQDGNTTYNEGINSGTPRQTSQVAGRTYTNTIVGLLWLAYMRATAASKNVPHKAFLRQSATDKELTLPVITSTAFGPMSAIFNSPPTGSWDLDGTPVLEIGSSRATDAANLIVTAIMAEGAALGATNKAPPNPPAVATDRRHLLGGVV